MNEPRSADASREERLHQVIAEYLEAEQSGRTPDREPFLIEHADLADQLNAFFADHDKMLALARPIQPPVKNINGTSFDQTAAFPHSPGNVVEAMALAPTQTFGVPDVTANAAAPSGGSSVSAFGDYELLGEIARGGMGVVFKARQISLNRIVALKMILAGQLASPEDVGRFHAEAEAAANLDHPGIVPIFDIGQHQGQHYFSMGYVEGHSLAERLHVGPVPPREAAELLRQVCEAMHYAHEHGVIHRDLKPANILLESPDARPRITDFGLAKRLKGDSHLTGTGQILGTPSYMSPEQAAGASGQIGLASDIYSLGAILYQLLTGRPPFQAETPLDTLLQVLDSDPLPPRLLNRDVPRDLESICMKCLDKDPARRYASARDLRDELRRYLEGESIHASSVNLLDRVTHALRQSRHEEQFRGWGLGLMAFGLVIFLTHVAIFVLEHAGQDPMIAYWLPRSMMFAALLIMLWRFRPHSLLPTNSVERLIWVVWIGYLLALAVVNVVLYIIGVDQGELYAFSAVLSGLGFLITGAHVWGGGYLIGLLFLLAAPVLAVYVDVASLAFGSFWAAAMLAFGLHYWRLVPRKLTTALPSKKESSGI